MGWGLLLMLVGMSMLDSDGLWYGIAIGLFVVGAGITLFMGNRRGWR